MPSRIMKGWYCSTSAGKDSTVSLQLMMRYDEKWVASPGMFGFRMICDFEVPRQVGKMSMTVPRAL